MTVEKIIFTIDEVRPNNVDKNTKILWLDILEKKIAEHMSRYSENKILTTPLSQNSETLLENEYMYMYVYYGVAMIDLENQDISMYNNSSTYFNDMFENWQKKWRREHTPQKSKGGDE